MTIALFSDCCCISDRDKWYRTQFKNDAEDWIDLRLSLPKSVHSLPLSTNVHSYAVSKLPIILNLTISQSEDVIKFYYINNGLVP